MGIGELFPGFLMALLLGILSGLGLGGGSLLVLWLTLVLGKDPSIAREISLLFFFPASLMSLLLQRKKLKVLSMLPAILPGILAAAAFSCLARVLDPGNFRKAMGMLLILLGLNQVFHRRKEEKP